MRELRKEHGESQDGFAAASGIDETDRGRIEEGERNFALRNIEEIAETLGMSVAELMEGV